MPEKYDSTLIETELVVKALAETSRLAVLQAVLEAPLWQWFEELQAYGEKGYNKRGEGSMRGARGDFRWVLL